VSTPAKVGDACVIGVIAELGRLGSVDAAQTAETDLVLTMPPEANEAA
jgi:hypothetical protein